MSKSPGNPRRMDIAAIFGPRDRIQEETAQAPSPSPHEIELARRARLRLVGEEPEPDPYYWVDLDSVFGRR